jgi:hypothetical protein
LLCFHTNSWLVLWLLSVYLCDRVRPNHYVGNTMTCHPIWHVKWKNGEERPRPRVGRDIQMRGLGMKRRRAVTADDESKDEEEEDAGGESDAATLASLEEASDEADSG